MTWTGSHTTQNMNQQKLLFLSASDVRKALPMSGAIEAMKKAFVLLTRNEVIMPMRVHIESEAQHGNTLFMPSSLPSENRIGIKVVSLFENNYKMGMPRLQALVLLVDGSNGSPLAIMDGASLTALRTGAASGAATDLLALPDANKAAIFGAGVQARTQLEAVCAVRNIQRAWVYDPFTPAAETFAQEMSQALGIRVTAALSADEALKEAQIVCAATTAKTPVFSDADIRPGTHINAVGSYQPWVQELPPETVIRARIIVDHRASALAETGDLIIPLQQKMMNESHIRAELGEILAGNRPGRTSDEEVTIFKSVGVAVQDLTAASRVFENASQAGLGTAVPL